MCVQRDGGFGSKRLAKHGVNLGGVQRVGDALDATGGLTRLDAVVEGLERDPPVGQLSLQPLVPVQAQLRRIRKVRAELDEDRAEVPVENVEEVLIDHRGRVAGRGD
jgi:hypothetical protein